MLRLVTPPDQPWQKTRLIDPKSEARFRAVFDSGLLGLTVFDAASGETLLINDRALEIIDSTREEFEAGARGCFSATPPEHLPLDDRAMRQISWKQVGPTRSRRNMLARTARGCRSGSPWRPFPVNPTAWWWV